MRYTPKLDIPKSEFITKVKVKGLPDKDENYVLVHADGKKEIVPVSCENSNDIDLQLQKQVISGIKAIPELVEERDELLHRGESNIKVLAGFYVLYLLNHFGGGPDELTTAFVTGNLGCGISVIRKLVASINRSRIALQFSTYDLLLQNIPLAATYLDREDKYSFIFLQGKTEEEQQKRYAEFKEMAERGRLPVSLLELETKQGATAKEIMGLSFAAYCNGYEPQIINPTPETSAARQYTRS